MVADEEEFVGEVEEGLCKKGSQHEAGICKKLTMGRRVEVEGY